MSDDPKGPRHKFRVAKADAKRRGIPFLFTFEEWWEFWGQDDRWSRRGRGGDNLVMARNGDTGPYAPWNVHCCTYAENQAEISRESYRQRGIKSSATRIRNGTLHLCQRGAGHPKSRPVRTPAGDFESGRLAAEHLGISNTTLYERVNGGSPGFRWLDTGRDNQAG